MSDKSDYIPLTDLILLQRGFDLPERNRTQGAVPVVASTGIAGYHNEAKVNAPGVVIGRSGSIGGGQYLTEDFWPLNTTLWVKNFRGHNPKYIYYLLKNIDFKRFNAGSGVPTLNRNHLEVINVLKFNKSEEELIANSLGLLDNKIDLLRRQNETLEAIAQTLFKRWFVEFEFPDESGLPYKSSGGKMVSSELGKIPEGWRVGKIKDFGNVVCGKTPSKAIIEYFNGDIPFIKIPDMHGTVFVIDTEDTLSEKGANSQQTKFLPAYSINVSCIATVGLVTINSKASHTNQQINSIIPINEFYLEYLFFSLKSLSNYLKSLGSGGSATLNVNTNTFSNIDLLIPKETAIKYYHNQVSAIFKKIELNAYSIINLQKIRDSLLPKLMSGQIRVTG